MRAKPEKKEEKEKVRLSLLSATLRLSAAHGFASVSLREVAREAGIAPTSFYRHFPDMEDLGRVLVDELVQALVQRYIARLDGAGHSERDVAQAILDELLSSVAQEPTLLRFLIAERVGAFVPIRMALTKQLEQLRAAFLRAFERTRPKGANVRPEAAQAAALLFLESGSAALDSAPEALEGLRSQALLQLTWLARVAAAGEDGVR